MTLTGRQVSTIATSSFNGRDSKKQVPVTVKGCGKLLKLSFQDSNKYAGIIKNDALVKLLQEFPVTVNAVLSAPVREEKTTVGKKAAKINFPRECTVRIAIRGFMTDENAIGNILGDSGLYLQCPSAVEYDSHVPYHNPHYLLRPGSQMPVFEIQSLGENGDSTEYKDLDEVDKGRFLRLFDEADDNGIEVRVQPSSRLQVTLKQ
ncbi:hypothetical protein QQS21_001232 [Conoideocrella luteorostrata]|uniref:Uncharacterized protein n=1 Tax=Conoideocrella luteorostrata TaxID=1105319 RepID=A0AAJ0G218_9HYPO|nr:hypothetical protein QQS21_001232 [Conoideocrella luteorostrata]